MNAKRVFEIIVIFFAVLITVHFAYAIARDDFAMMTNSQLDSLITITQQPTTIDLNYLTYNYMMHTYRADAVNQSIGFTPFDYHGEARLSTALLYACHLQYGYSICFNNFVMANFQFVYLSQTVTPAYMQFNQTYQAEKETLYALRDRAAQDVLLQTYQATLGQYTLNTLPNMATSTSSLTTTTVSG